MRWPVRPGTPLVRQGLGQALELLLLTHLVRRLEHLEGARDSAAVFLYLLVAQSTGPAWTVEMGLLVVVLAVVEARHGGGRRALRLGTSWMLSAAVVLVFRYTPSLIGWPRLAGVGAEPGLASPGNYAVATALGALAGSARSGDCTVRQHGGCWARRSPWACP